jgi:hypothetical protein
MIRRERLRQNPTLLEVLDGLLFFLRLLYGFRSPGHPVTMEDVQMSEGFRSRVGRPRRVCPERTPPSLRFWSWSGGHDQTTLPAKR